MITGFNDLFTTLLFSLVLALILSPGLIWISVRLGFVDRPGSAAHKQHQTPTPTAGGLVFALSLGLCVVLLQPVIIPGVSSILIGVYSITLLGLVDDYSDLPPIVKLAGQLLIVSVVILLNIQIHITRIVWLDILLSYLWMVGIINAFNFVDSMDGLASGLAGIAAAFFMLATRDAQQPHLAVLAAAILGAMIGSFIYLAPPAKMFLGDSGSQALGMALATLGITYTPAQAGLPQGLTWFIPILVLGIPIFDMVLVVISRVRRREPVYLANTDHLYHRIVIAGVQSTRAVAIMQVVAIVLNLAAFIALGTSVLIANTLFVSLCIAGIVCLYVLEWKFRTPVTKGEEQESGGKAQ
jgi:UDP-GlcNAc:undecaprenyl-phosphate GlcNAc-1-phosphate transferase